MIHIPFAVQLPTAMASMALKDATATLTGIAANRGHGRLAGALDATNDAAAIGVQLSGVGSILIGGASVRTAVVIGAMMITSYFGTVEWTKLGKRIAK